MIISYREFVILEFNTEKPDRCDVTRVYGTVRLSFEKYEQTN